MTSQMFAAFLHSCQDAKYEGVMSQLHTAGPEDQGVQHNSSKDLYQAYAGSPCFYLIFNHSN